MRMFCKVLLSLVLLQGFAYAEEPEIQVVNGKVTMSAQAVPLGRLLSLLDRAMGLNSQVLKPELASRTVSVRFSDLDLREAVRKIFEGQPLNYILIEGKGIRVTDLASNTPSSTSTASTFPAPDSFSSVTPTAPAQPILAPPVNAAGQPVPLNVPFGAPPNQNQNQNPNSYALSPGAPSAIPGMVAPGQVPPPLGSNNALTSPVSGTPTVAPVPAPALSPSVTGGQTSGGASAPTGGFPATPPALAPVPAGPGVSNATPGVAPR